MKGKILLYGGFFVAMLLLATYPTGVLQQGILPLLRPQAPAADHNGQPAAGEQQPESQERDEESTVVTEADEGTSSGPTEERPTDASTAQGGKHATVAAGSSTGIPEHQRSATIDQEKLLAEKRAELDRLEEQIRKRKEESEVEGKWVAELKASRTTLTKERDVRREAGIKKLAKLYEGMEPEAAATILGKLKKEMATAVLASMKDRQASKVLAAMNGSQAKELSERLEEVKLDPARESGEGR